MSENKQRKTQKKDKFKLSQYGKVLWRVYYDDLIFDLPMKDKTYFVVINYIYSISAIVAYGYLFYLFYFTPFLKQEKDNTLIPLLITYLLGVALKSFYTFFVLPITIDYDKKPKSYQIITKAIDFMTGVLFLCYVNIIINNHYLTPLFIFVGLAIVISIYFTNKFAKELLYKQLEKLFTLKRK